MVFVWFFIDYIFNIWNTSIFFGTCMNQGKRTEIKQNFNRLTTMLFLNIKKEGGFKLDVLSECCFFFFRKGSIVCNCAQFGPLFRKKNQIFFQ